MTKYDKNNNLPGIRETRGFKPLELVDIKNFLETKARQSSKPGTKYFDSSDEHKAPLTGEDTLPDGFELKQQPYLDLDTVVGKHNLLNEGSNYEGVKLVNPSQLIPDELLKTGRIAPSKNHFVGVRNPHTGNPEKAMVYSRGIVALLNEGPARSYSILFDGRKTPSYSINNSERLKPSLRDEISGEFEDTLYKHLLREAKKHDL